jgi:hypothetical protein
MEERRIVEKEGFVLKKNIKKCDLFFNYTFVSIASACSRSANVCPLSTSVIAAICSSVLANTEINVSRSSSPSDPNAALICS